MAHSLIPLDNGHYQDAQAQASASNTRVVGQKDLVNGRGHLWIQNQNHEWFNVVNGIAYGQLSGTVTVPGFTPVKATRSNGGSSTIRAT